MPTKQQIDLVESIIESEREQLVSTLVELIRVPSKRSPAVAGMPFGKDCADALALALNRAASLGFATENKENILGWVEFGQGEELLAILAHLDVVPEGEGWTVDPFGGEIKDGFVYGRGSQDDKGPAVSALFAMHAIKKAGIPLNKRVRLILGCDEESGSSDIRYYLEHCEIPTMCFSPDADYPLVNGEKGLLRLSLTAKFPQSEKLPRLLHAAGGERANIVAPKAYAVVEGFSCSEIEGICKNVETRLGVSILCMDCPEPGCSGKNAVRIDVSGKAAHAASPQEGNSANTALFELLSLLPLGDSSIKARLVELNRLLPHGDTRGRAAGIARKDEISGELTCNPGIFSLNSDGFEVTLDIRYPIEAKGDAILSDFQRATELLSVSLKTDNPPHYVSPKSPLVKNLLAAYTDVTGNEAYCICIGGGTYARDFEEGVSFGCMFPGGEDRMHQADERVKIDDLVLNARIMARAILYLACDCASKTP
ncbi:MAG: dipeptidase PepV [Christensenellales bacterium]|jgi:succinyl-diaminopimelate desuccinylase